MGSWVASEAISSSCEAAKRVKGGHGVVGVRVGGCCGRGCGCIGNHMGVVWVVKGVAVVCSVVVAVEVC